MFYAAMIAGFLSGSSVVLAWYFGRLFDLPACDLCIYARWLTATFSVACFGLAWLEKIAMNGRSKLFYGLLFIGFMGVGVSAFHSLIERGVVQMPMACAQSQVNQIESAQGFKNLIERKAPARCDKISWSLLGLSLANYNGLFTLALLGALAYARKKSG